MELKIGDPVRFYTSTRWGKSGVRPGVVTAIHTQTGPGGGERVTVKETVDGVDGYVSIRRGWIV